MGVHTDGEGFLAVFVEGVGRHGDDGDVRVGPAGGTDGLGGLVAVHHRHFPQENQQNSEDILFRTRKFLHIPQKMAEQDLLFVAAGHLIEKTAPAGTITKHRRKAHERSCAHQ